MTFTDELMTFFKRVTPMEMIPYVHPSYILKKWEFNGDPLESDKMEMPKR